MRSKFKVIDKNKKIKLEYNKKNENYLKIKFKNSHKKILFDIKNLDDILSCKEDNIYIKPLHKKQQYMHIFIENDNLEIRIDNHGIWNKIPIKRSELENIKNIFTYFKNFKI